MAANPDLTRESENGLQPDLSEAQRFLNVLDPRGTFTFQTFTDSKPTPRPDPLAKVRHGSLGRHADELIDLNRRGAGIFVMVNEGDGVGRRNGNVLRIRAFFVDLDGAPLEPVRVAEPLAHIIVQSSPGRWHAYWLVSDAPCDEEQFARVQKALTAKYRSDESVHDLARVMRLPGFFHQKQEPFMSYVVFPKKDAP